MSLKRTKRPSFVSFFHESRSKLQKTDLVFYILHSPCMSTLSKLTASCPIFHHYFAQKLYILVKRSSKTLSIWRLLFSLRYYFLELSLCKSDLNLCDFTNECQALLQARYSADNVFINIKRIPTEQLSSLSHLSSCSEDAFSIQQF